jgi:hypothetical protein
VPTPNRLKSATDDGGFRLDALIMVRSSLRISAATANGFRNAPVPAIPDSAFERGIVALRKHCETASRSGRCTGSECVRSPQMAARGLVGFQAESVGFV